MTPLKGLTWVYNTIYLNDRNDSEVWYEHMQWEDNPYLSREEIDKLTSSLSSDELESRKYGNFTSGTGLVYNEFDENLNVIDPFDVPTSWYDKISIDPGLHNPLSCHWYACDYDGNVYVIAEHYDKQKTVNYHAEKIKEISNRLQWPTKNGRIEAIIDSAANQRTLASEKSVSELFYDNGILVNPYVNKDLFSGINRVKAYLRNSNGERKLFIFKTCVNMIREIKGYFWSDADVPVKKDDHALDELRYYIMSKPENKISASKTKSPLQQNKDRLIRQNKINNYWN